MEQYIEKSALVAKINKRIIDAPVNNIGHQRVWAYNDVKDIIDTLEVKEVDLEKILIGFQNRYAYENSGEFPSAIEVAKHFFELGLSVSNESQKEK